MPAAATAAALGLALVAALAALGPAAPAHAARARSATAHAASSSPTPSSGAGAAAASSSSCPDYEFIGARGSGEDNSIPTKKRYTAANPTWGMGGEVADVFKRLDKTASANGVTIAPYGVPYPAVGIDVVSGDALVSGDLSIYSKSVELGAHAAAAELDRVSRACPHTGVIIAGYSQGAQTTVDAVLSATPSARSALVAAVFFGNTYFNASDTGEDFGSFAPGLDGYLVHSGTGPGSGSQGGRDWASRFDGVPIFDYCHDGDPICGLIDERRVDGVSYPVRDFAHIVSSSADDAGDPSIFTNHTDYQRGDTANAAQQLRFVLGLPLLDAPKATAKITAPQTTEVGTETHFNAGGSLSDPADPIVSYDWTIDPGTDGVYHLTTVDPLMTDAFTTPGTHTVQLRTSTLSGKHATASVSLTATAPATAAPAAPTRITATAGDGAVALDWPAVRGADFYAVTDADGKVLTAFTPLVAGQTTVSWTDTGLSNGRERDYRVYAVNGMGRSDASAQVSATPQAAPTRPAAAAVRLPEQTTTLVEPELVWSLGLGLIVVMLALSLLRTRPETRRRSARR